MLTGFFCVQVRYCKGPGRPAAAGCPPSQAPACLLTHAPDCLPTHAPAWPVTVVELCASGNEPSGSTKPEIS